MLQRAKKFYHEHEPACTAGLFIAGFLFDTLAVGRIDKLHNIVHQASYLALCAWFTSLELRESHGQFSPPERLRTAWRYHAGATHFMLGTLLNIYTLFYFKSASLVASFVFMIILAALLAVNELKPFGEGSGTAMRMALFSLCLISYFTYLVPVLVGSIGAPQFLASLACASAVIAALVWRLRLRLPDRPQVIVRHMLAPFLGMALLFSWLYFAKLIPPVPLSISEIGIYHDVKREGQDFVLTSARPRWKFWQKGDQTFLARPADKVHCYVSVFSPTRFRERLQVRWLFKDPQAGWLDADAIALDITGGRDGGFRGDTVKGNYRPGRWRVKVETSDGRELGRIDLKIVEDLSTGGRPWRAVRR